VDNDVQADGKDLVIITGANTGGKSTMLRSIGLAQVMMQCGMFVPATMFRAEICPRILTHYKREEDTTMKSGKFDEELARMSRLRRDNIPYRFLFLGCRTADPCGRAIATHAIIANSNPTSHPSVLVVGELDETGPPLTIPHDAAIIRDASADTQVWMSAWQRSGGA
jgi:hypothetical protein